MIGDMEIHARIEEYKASIYNLLVRSEVEDPDLLSEDEMLVLVQLCNNVNKRLEELEGEKEKVTFLRNLLMTITATNMIATKRALGDV